VDAASRRFNVLSKLVFWAELSKVVKNFRPEAELLTIDVRFILISWTIDF
jgi:hypothetical protein